jgi:hypothetical protein
VKAFQSKALGVWADTSRALWKEDLSEVIDDDEGIVELIYVQGFGSVFVDSFQKEYADEFFFHKRAL